MGSHIPNVKDNPPASTFPLQEHDEFALTVSQKEAADSNRSFHTGNSGGSDLMHFPFLSLPVNPSPWGSMHATYQPFTHGIPETGGNLMADFMRPNGLPNPVIDPCPINLISNTPRIRSLSEISFLESNTTGIQQPVNHDYMVNAGNEMNGHSCFSTFQNPKMNRNIVLTRGNAAEGYQISRKGGEARSSDPNWPKINGNFVSLGGSTPVLYHTQNGREMVSDNNVKVIGDQLGCPEKIDGSFLSLGIGGNTQARSKSTFNSHEITRKLEESDSLKLNASRLRRTTRSSSSLCHNLAAGVPSFESNAGGISSSVCNVGGWTSSNNEGGVLRGANTGLSSSPFHILQASQVEIKQNSSMSSNRNSGLVSKRNARNADLAPYKFRGDQAASSGAFSSSSAWFPSSLQNGSSRLEAESSNPMWISARTTSDQLEKCRMNTAKNFSSESSMNSPFLGLRGSSTGRDHSGPLFPASECGAIQAAESGQFTQIMCAQPAGQLFSAHDGTTAQAGGSQFFRRIGVQVTGTASHAARDGLFPKRLGVQVNEGGAAQATEGDLFPKGMCFQTAGKLCQLQESGSIQFPKSLCGPPFAFGWPEGGMPAQFSIDFRGPPSTTGQPHDGVPVQFSKDLRRRVSTTGQVIPVAKVNGLSQTFDVLGRPSLKRSAVQPPPAAPWVQRRKIIPQQPIHPSMPYPPQTYPALIPIPAPALAASHIKWQGSDGPPQPAGQKCLLCKRDLSFTPEGLVHQPTVLPAVAVLPCGHTFHDHCLQIITPEDQCKSPPCIPCAIGEN